MKKLIYSATLMVLAFFAASCQQENLEPVAGGETVSYKVQVPDALATKASGDGFTVYYQVYRDADLKNGDFLYDGSKEFSGGSATLDLKFVRNQNFTVLFWAQKTENVTAYDIDDLRNVQLATLTTNDANAEVFVGTDNVEDCVSIKKGIVELKRPVAQLNIATLTSGLKLGETSNAHQVDPSKVKVTLHGLYTSYNVATGDVDTSADVEFHEANSIKNEFITGYTHLVQNFIGFIPKDGDNIDVDFTINTEEDGYIEHSVSNVPVKPNYRTNIIGNLVSGTAGYSITIDEAWTTPDNTVEVVTVSNAADLQDAIYNIQDGTEGNIKLEGDIDLGALAGMISTKADEPAVPTYGLVIPAAKAVVIDLNGNTLSQTVNQTGAYSMIQNSGNLTIIDSKGTGKIAYGDTGNGGNYVSNTIGNSGTLVIESGLIENNSSANVAANGYPHPIDNSGELIINGGTLTNNANYSSMRIWCTTDDDTSVTINGGTFNGSIDFQTPNASANKGSLTINGGTFNADTYTKCAVRLLGFGADVDEMLGYINGGTFNGEIALKNWSGAEFNSQVFYITGGQFSVDPSAFVVDGYPVVAPEAEGGYFTIGEYTTVAKIGDQEYGSLRAAVDAVEDGGTITLVANETFTKANRCDNGGWWDGLAYSGDKSFTIDLDGHTITQDGSLNDYLIWIKNDGEKANTITFKNGTMDAGTTAYSALATASSNAQKMTVNLENINLINNISNGAVVKARGGSVLNVKAGTVITGKDSYVGIEAVGNNTVVNVYDGAEIYQNGTSSYVGAIIGASYNATLNINGGKGKSAKCGIIVMSTGATINVSGGEWTANGDGTVAAGNNGVLVSQNNRYESGWACKSVLNVTGGTFKGGYDCWGMGPGQEPDDAQINIMGGNFNSDPSTYLVTDYKAEEANGTWTVTADTSFIDFVNAVIENNGTYDGEGMTVKIVPASGDAREANKNFNVPARLQKYGNPDCYYAQYQLFGGLTDVNVSNVNFVFVPREITVMDPWNPTGATTNVSNVNGELQFVNSGKVTLTGCTFETVAVSPIKASELNITECMFNDLKAYAIKDIYASAVVINENTFDNCNGGFWFADAPSDIQAKDNSFIEVGRRGAIQFSSTGDYKDTVIEITGNTVTGGAFLWQLNSTVTYDQVASILETGNNTYETAYVAGSTEPKQPSKIFYVSSEMALEPTNPDALNAEVVTNVWDKTTGEGVITFDGPLTVIGEKAFQRETNTTPSNWATSITLPEGLETIGNYAFAQCYSLTNITIPDSVTSIGQFAFQSCDAVTNVTIGSGVTTIGSSAFYNCYEIKEIVCKATTPPALADKYVFNEVPKDIKVVVPVAALDTYKAAEHWKSFTNIVAE